MVSIHHIHHILHLWFAEIFKDSAKNLTIVLLRSKQRILKEFVEDNYEPSLKAF